MSATQPKVLVLCATGKTGKNVSTALKDEGFKVYGTTRSPENKERLTGRGITPVIANYTYRSAVDFAIKESGGEFVFAYTDYFLAGKSNTEEEIKQGKQMIDAAREGKVKHLVFMTCSGIEIVPEQCKHITGKGKIEEYLKESGISYTILRPVAFFENFDDNANWNPLKKGGVKFLSDAKIKFCSTYDIGRAAAVIFNNNEAWKGKTLDVASWEGTMHEVSQVNTFLEENL